MAKDQKAGYLNTISEGKIKVRVESDDSNLIGKFIDVNIESAADFSLEGLEIQIAKAAI